jgi:hypothetical protein
MRITVTTVGTKIEETNGEPLTGFPSHNERQSYSLSHSLQSALQAC